MSWEVRQGDALERLREMEAESVQAVVTSPPYWGLRSYNGGEAEMGLEDTPEQYVANLVEVFREVRRVLRKDGTVWLNLGDSYNTAGGLDNRGKNDALGVAPRSKALGRAPGLKPKDLCGIPWRVAFALQADGWWLRSDIIWSKPNPMPESVTDRPTRAHEYLFLLTRSARYFYDADAIRERAEQPEGVSTLTGQHKVLAESMGTNGAGNSTLGTNQGASHRNRRSVWEIATTPFAAAHFAVFPPKLVEPCILAGSRAYREPTTWNATFYSPESEHVERLRSIVLDPFCGSGTTGVVALRHDRSFIGIELNESYCELARNRIRDDAPLLNTQLEAVA